MQVQVANGSLRIVTEGRASKFRRKVQEKTFAGISCRGRNILYVTERCVFKLIEKETGPQIQLIEVAPGICLQEDILKHMEFEPVMHNIQLMDERCFRT